MKARLEENPRTIAEAEEALARLIGAGVWTVVALALLLALTGCGGGDPEPETPRPICRGVEC